MKEKINILIFCALFAYTAGTTAQAQSLKTPDNIKSALETGNSKELSRFFNSSVELVLNQNQNIYGKSQAEKLLKTFFDDNGPKFRYEELHSSGKDLSHCNFIGQLYTSKGTYRISIYIKSSQIYQMRLEENTAEI